MPQVLTITSSPDYTIVSAYRPILFTVNVADTEPPKAVYCDVYVNGVFYRTLVKTQYSSLGAGSSNWIFDIQVPCQEVIGKYVPVYGGSNVILARPCTAQVYCKFRGSTIDADGFLVPEEDVPVQATGTTAAVAGGGELSTTLFVLNVALQHQNSQDLPIHLQAYENGTWGANTLPMSHRLNNYVVGVADNDYYAIFYNGSGSITKLKLNYRNKGETSYTTLTEDVSVVNEEAGAIGALSLYYIIVLNGDGTQTVTFYFPTDPDTVSIDVQYNDGTTHSFPGGAVAPRSITIPQGTYTYFLLLHTVFGDVLVSASEGLEEVPSIPATKGLFYIPNGPMNLTALFPAVVWKNVKDYYVEVVDDSDDVIATSTVNKIQEWVNSDHVRLYFLNYCGTYDGVNFLKPKALLEDTSSEFQKTVGSPLLKSDFSTVRNNVRFNNTKEVKRNSLESEMPWLEECKVSPEVYEDWTPTEGQSAGYMSVVILNGKVDSLKNVDDYLYQFTIQYKQANEGFSIRN